MVTLINATHLVGAFSMSTRPSSSSSVIESIMYMNFFNRLEPWMMRPISQILSPKQNSTLQPLASSSWPLGMRYCGKPGSIAIT
jgi:hypothetical protein